MMTQIRIRLFTLAALLLATTIACTTLLPGSGNGALTPTDQSQSAGGTLDCQQNGYPCSLAETEPAALARSGQVMELAEDIYLESGSMLAAAEQLAEEDDIVELAYDETGLWYRVEGAPPMWLWDYDDINDPPSEAESAAPQGAPLLRPMPQDSGPVGEQNPGQEPEKKALIMLPWAYAMLDDSAQVANTLSQHRNYQCAGCIDQQVIRQDPRQGEPDGQGYYGPSLDRFNNWDTFDFLYIYSHGRQWCGLPDEATGGFFIEGQSRPIGDCAGMLTTGRFRESIFDDASTLDTPGVAWGHKPGDDWWIEALSPDFFRARYGGGLQDSILVFNTCQLLKNDSFASAVAGADTAVIGWTQSVRYRRAVPTTAKLFEALVEDGLRIESALDLAKETEDYATDDTYAGAELKLYGDEQARAVEIVTWMHPIYESEVKEIGSLPIEGVPNDGQNDQLLVRFRVDGIDEDQDPGAFPIQVMLDGQRQETTLTPQDKVDDYSYEVSEMIDLNFDVNGRDQMELEAWIDLPEGGQTRHYLEEERLASCGWRGSIAGARSGDIKGDIALDLVRLTEVDPAQLDELEQLGLLESFQGMPDLSGMENAPDAVMLTGQDPFPAISASSLGGIFVLFNQTEVAADVESPASLTFTQRTDDYIAGTVNGNLTYLPSQQGMSLNVNFIWNAGSFCDFNLILAAAAQQASTGGVE